MDINKLLHAFRKKLLLENMLHSGLIALSLSVFSVFVTSLFFHIMVRQTPLPLTVCISAAVFLLSFLIPFLIHYPTDKRVAARVDTLGLQERASTMLEYRNETTQIAQHQHIMLSETEQVTVNSLITDEFTPVIAADSVLTAEIDISSLPTIYGYLGTTIKTNAAAYITTEESHPIYAVWTYGHGTVACFTSDLNGIWSSDWIADSTGIALTQSMVATTIDEVHHDSSLSAEITVRGQTTDIAVTAAGNTDSTLSLTAASDSGTKTYVLTQTDPGVFTASIKTAQAGIYELLIIQTDAEDSIVDYLETAIAVSYSSEYDAFADSGEPLLSTLCSYSGGAIFTDMQKLAEVAVSSISIIYNPIVVFSVIIAIFMLADIAIRKLRWKDIRNYLRRK